MGETLLERRERIDLVRHRLNMEVHSHLDFDDTWRDLVHAYWWTAHLAAYLVKEQVR